MKIIKPYAKILGNEHTNFDSMKKIEWCSRISHRSEEAQTEDSWKRFIKAVVIDHGDWSVVEHVSVTVDAIMDRGITHEWVRHRLFSFTQESTRFVNYEKKMPPAFIYPKPEVDCSFCISGEELKRGADYGLSSFRHSGITCGYDKDWLQSIYEAERSYKALLAKGWRPQEARSVFPNALASRIVTTGNLRNWRHFFSMRVTAAAHPQMRQITIPLLAEFKEAFPLLFDEIIPNSKQSESMKIGR